MYTTTTTYSPITLTTNPSTSTIVRLFKILVGEVVCIVVVVVEEVVVILGRRVVIFVVGIYDVVLVKVADVVVNVSVVVITVVVVVVVGVSVSSISWYSEQRGRCCS